MVLMCGCHIHALSSSPSSIIIIIRRRRAAAPPSSISSRRLNYLPSSATIHDDDDDDGCCFASSTLLLHHLPFPLFPAAASLISRRRRRHLSSCSRTMMMMMAKAKKRIAEDEDPAVFCSVSDFMRFNNKSSSGGDQLEGELQTAIVTYKKRFPCSLLDPFFQVDLVSTIHIADQEYFTKLQNDLESYDTVLYEMVTSRESLQDRRIIENTKELRSHSKGFNVIGFIQRQMARLLALDFQLDCLDYKKNRWYHADLDYETFRSLQMERGESLFTFAADMTIQSTKAISQSTWVTEDLDPLKSKLLWASRSLPMPLIGLLIIGSICAQSDIPPMEYPEVKALSRLDFGSAMKIFLAKRLTEFKLMSASAEEKSVIIGERNRVAVEALRRAMNDGCKKIAIVYGGGHMPDMGRRLKEEFNLVPSHVSWVSAWSITSNGKRVKDSSFPFLAVLAQVSGWPLNRYQTLALLIFSSVLAVDLWFWELFFSSTVHWASETAEIICNSHVW